MKTLKNFGEYYNIKENVNEARQDDNYYIQTYGVSEEVLDDMINKLYELWEDKDFYEDDEDKAIELAKRFYPHTDENLIRDMFSDFIYDNEEYDFDETDEFPDEEFESKVNEKWEKNVKIKKTGEHAGKTVAEIRKQMDNLKGKKPFDREKYSELMFALRAKGGWKKGKGATKRKKK